MSRKRGGDVRSTLAMAREERGWSQARLVAELEHRARAAGMAVMSRSSLKTALSRWENGHVVPDRHYRRLLADIFGLTNAELGIADAGAGDRRLAASHAPDTASFEGMSSETASADLRRHIEQLLDVDAGTRVTGLEERVSLQAQDCVRVAPPAMLQRLLSDFKDVQALLQQAVTPSLRPRLYEVAANLSVLVGDELMVLGRPADSQAWYTTAKAAALRTSSPAVLARALSLNPCSTSITAHQPKRLRWPNRPTP
jgi:transcriptional regulator with XRE-family HTH domain